MSGAINPLATTLTATIRDLAAADGELAAERARRLEAESERTVLHDLTVALMGALHDSTRMVARQRETIARLHGLIRDHAEGPRRESRAA